VLFPVFDRVHQSMRRRGSLWHPRLPRVHVCTTGGTATLGKPLAMYGADRTPCGKSGVNCQVPPRSASATNRILVLRHQLNVLKRQAPILLPCAKHIWAQVAASELCHGILDR
jgi:hypothetical protein